MEKCDPCPVSPGTWNVVDKTDAASLQAVERGHQVRDPERHMMQSGTAPVEEGREYLCSLPGVGRKTAACVLLFSYDSIARADSRYLADVGRAVFAGTETSHDPGRR